MMLNSLFLALFRLAALDSIQMFIHILKLRFKVAFQLRPFNLECGRQETVLHRERIGMQIDVLDLHEKGNIRKLMWKCV